MQHHELPHDAQHVVELFRQYLQHGDDAFDALSWYDDDNLQFHDVFENTFDRLRQLTIVLNDSFSVSETEILIALYTNDDERRLLQLTHYCDAAIACSVVAQRDENNKLQLFNMKTNAFENV